MKKWGSSGRVGAWSQPRSSSQRATAQSSGRESKGPFPRGTPQERSKWARGQQAARAYCQYHRQENPTGLSSQRTHPSEQAQKSRMGPRSTDSWEGGVTSQAPGPTSITEGPGAFLETGRYPSLGAAWQSWWQGQLAGEQLRAPSVRGGGPGLGLVAAGGWAPAVPGQGQSRRPDGCCRG